MKPKSALLVLLLITTVVHAQFKPPVDRPRRLRASYNRLENQGAPANAISQLLPIKRVILYSNGVAYIERRGLVSGHAEVNLSFKQSEVDDVLKSMVVLDLGHGRIGAVSYNSSAPPSARMAEIPFTIESETKGEAKGAGLAGVLGQMQGARVMITTANRTVTGALLTVEEKKKQSEPNKPLLYTHAIVLAGADGELLSFDLSEVRSVKLLDEGAKRDISEFAGASASARRRDAKTITVTSDGAGSREMLVSYIVAAPIWKTTYRVVLDAEGHPFFQGWAIVDNVGEEDWNDVELSLISGTPISFVQPMQKPFYRYRPVVPMPDDLRLMPQVYEPGSGEEQGNGNTISGIVADSQGSVVPNATVLITNNSTGQRVTVNTNSDGSFRTSMLAAGLYTVTIDAAGFRTSTYSDVRVNPVRSTFIRVALEVGGVSEAVTVSSSAVVANRSNNISNLSLIAAAPARVDAEATLGATLASGEAGVEAAAEGSEMGDLFEYKIDRPVNIKRDRSALIPILQTKLDGERVSIFNQSSGRVRPMSGLLLKNTSSLTLEDGALTVIDGNAYAGEALMERLKPAEQRLISFALDLGTLVSVKEDEDRGPVFSVKIVNGSMQASFHNFEKKIYKLTNQTERERIVFVEHPVRDDWVLDTKETPKPEGRSARFYRFRIALKPHATIELPVTEQEVLFETYALTNISSQQLQLFVSQRYIDEQTRAALQTVLDLKGRIAAYDASIASFDKELKEISDDQKRLRENIEALTKTAEAKQLIARYVTKADQQETRIEQLTKEKQQAVNERQKLQAQLESLLQSLTYQHELQ